MKKLLFLACFLFMFSPTAKAQLGNVRVQDFAGVPSGACQGTQLARNTSASPDTYYGCDAGAWHLITGDITGIASVDGQTGDGSGNVDVAVGTAGTDVAVSTAANVITINVPSASATARGVVTTGTQTMAGAKTFSTSVTTPFLAASTGTLATTGLVRAANNTNATCWRNAANDANLCLSVDASDNFLFNGMAIGGSGASAFTDLTDAPMSYTGHAGKYVAVNAMEDAVEFIAPPTIPDSITELSDVVFTMLTEGDVLCADAMSNIVNCAPTGPAIVGTPTTGNCVQWASASSIEDAGDACGTGGTGDNVLVNTSAATNADFTDGTQIAWTLDTMPANDTLVASIVAGSVTATEIATDGVGTAEIDDGSVAPDDVGAKLKTFSASFNLETPVTGDSYQVRIMNPANAITITRLQCDVKSATSVTINLREVSEGTPRSGGTAVATSNLVCDTDGANTTTFSNAGIAQHAPVVLEITAVSGTPEWVSGTVEYTIDN